MDFRFDEVTQAVVAEVLRASPLRADDAAFLATQLTTVRETIYRTELPQPRGLQIVPVSAGIPDWAEIVKTLTMFEVGEAKVISDYADDLPAVDAGGKETFSRVRTVGDHYRYNIAEMRGAATGRVNMPAEKGLVARNAIETKLSKIALNGDTQYGMAGLLTTTAIGTVAIAGNWASASPAAILADLAAIVTAIPTQSGSTYYANKLVMPTSVRTQLVMQVVPDTMGATVMQRFQAAFPRVVVEDLADMEAANGSRQIIAGEFAEVNASLDLPIPFFQLPPQAINLHFRVPCIARTSGVNVRRPLAFAKGVGI